MGVLGFRESIHAFHSTLNCIRITLKINIYRLLTLQSRFFSGGGGGGSYKLEITWGAGAQTGADTGFRKGGVQVTVKY